MYFRMKWQAVEIELRMASSQLEQSSKSLSEKVCIIYTKPYTHHTDLHTHRHLASASVCVCK